MRHAIGAIGDDMRGRRPVPDRLTIGAVNKQGYKRDVVLLDDIGAPTGIGRVVPEVSQRVCRRLKGNRRNGGCDRMTGS